jgi:hypothetical protein
MPWPRPSTPQAWDVSLGWGCLFSVQKEALPAPDTPPPTDSGVPGLTYITCTTRTNFIVHLFRLPGFTSLREVELDVSEDHVRIKALDRKVLGVPIEGWASKGVNRSIAAMGLLDRGTKVEGVLATSSWVVDIPLPRIDVHESAHLSRLDNGSIVLEFARVQYAPSIES